MPPNKKRPDKFTGTVQLQKKQLVFPAIDTSSISSINGSGELIMMADAIGYIPDEYIGIDHEPIIEFEARRIENLKLLECPEKELTDIEKINNVLKRFPPKVWPLQVSYW